MSARCASASPGVGTSSTARGSTRSVRSYTRSKLPRRLAVVMRPIQNSHSSARLVSPHSHHPLLLLPSAKSELPSGPSPSIRASTASTSSRCSLAKASDASPHTLPPLRPGHAPAQQGLVPDRQERGLMRPIFEQPARLFSPGGAVQLLARIGAEPGEERHVVRPHQHVDAVDLVECEPLRDSPNLPRPRRRRSPRAMKPLRRQCNPPRLRSRQARLQVVTAGAVSGKRGIATARARPSADTM
jgi:hypothetical protein